MKFDFCLIFIVRNTKVVEVGYKKKFLPLRLVNKKRSVYSIPFDFHNANSFNFNNFLPVNQKRDERLSSNLNSMKSKDILLIRLSKNPVL